MVSLRLVTYVKPSTFSLRCIALFNGLFRECLRTVAQSCDWQMLPWDSFSLDPDARHWAASSMCLGRGPARKVSGPLASRLRAAQQLTLQPLPEVLRAEFHDRIGQSAYQASQPLQCPHDKSRLISL